MSATLSASDLALLGGYQQAGDRPGAPVGVGALTGITAYAVSRPPGKDADAVSALATLDGSKQWISALPATMSAHSNLVVANGMVFAGAGDHTCMTLLVLDAADGRAIASVTTGMPTDGGEMCALAVADSRVILRGDTDAGPEMRLLALP